MEISKYLILLMMVIYTFECFSVFGYHDAYTKMWKTCCQQYVYAFGSRVYHADKVILQ